MDAEVIVVGAGPAGLMLAGELCLAGVRTVVLERLAEPTGQSRGLGFQARTMEVFDQRGLLSRFGDIEVTNAGHFGGIPIDFGVLGDGHAGVKGIPQSRTEEVLGGWATGLGADVRRGHEVVGLSSGDAGVEVRVETPAGPETMRAAYVVGCDGGRSAVRKLGGFDFPGTAATMEMYLADVQGCNLRPRMIGETSAGGMVMAGPLGPGIDRIIVCERGTPPGNRTGPPPFSEVAAAWKRLTGEDISGGTPLWVSAFGDATRQVTEYRRGRVLLAGDAAHIHLPAGGQGLNVSVQDAVNLGWKLAATVHGWAPDDLLDTYHDERHPVGQRLLLNTRAQGMLFLSGSEMQPLRSIMTELIAFEEVSRHLAGMVSGLDIRYDGGPGAHSLRGRRMPRLDLVRDGDKCTSTELLTRGRAVLLSLADDPALHASAYAWADRLDPVTATAHDAAQLDRLDGARTVLIRPDGHVAWTASDDEPLTQALRRWLGAPR